MIWNSLLTTYRFCHTIPIFHICWNKLLKTPWILSTITCNFNMKSKFIHCIKIMYSVRVTCSVCMSDACVLERITFFRFRGIEFYYVRRHIRFAWWTRSRFSIPFNQLNRWYPTSIKTSFDYFNIMFWWGGEANVLFMCSWCVNNVLIVRCQWCVDHALIILC